MSCWYNFMNRSNKKILYKECLGSNFIYQDKGTLNNYNSYFQHKSCAFRPRASMFLHPVKINLFILQVNCKQRNHPPFGHYPAIIMVINPTWLDVVSSYVTPFKLIGLWWLSDNSEIHSSHLFCLMLLFPTGVSITVVPICTANILRAASPN